MSVFCESCGKPWAEHDGIMWTCKRYHDLIANLERIVSEVALGNRPGVTASELAVEVAEAIYFSKGEP